MSILVFLWRWKAVAGPVMGLVMVLAAVAWLRYDAVEGFHEKEAVKSAKEAFDTLKEINNAPTFTHPDAAREWLREYGAR